MSAEPCGPREAGCASLSEGRPSAWDLPDRSSEPGTEGVGRVGSGHGETAQGFRAVRRWGGTALGAPQPSPWAGVCGELGGVEAGGLGAGGCTRPDLVPWGPSSHPGLARTGLRSECGALGTGPSGPGAPRPRLKDWTGPAACAFTPRQAAPRGRQRGGGPRDRLAWVPARRQVGPSTDGSARGFPPHSRMPRASQWLPGRVQTAWAPASLVRAPGPDVAAACRGPTGIPGGDGPSPGFFLPLGPWRFCPGALLRGPPRPGPSA